MFPRVTQFYLIEETRWKKRCIAQDPVLFQTLQIPAVMEIPRCQAIIHQAETLARHRGWSTSRHRHYPTTDLPVSAIRHLTPWLHNWVRRVVFPPLATHFDLEVDCLNFNDLFIVKYTTTGQASLEPHRDGCLFSFNILLNSEQEFDGGGTRIIATNQILIATQGMLTLHSGRVYHEGVAITRGVRYLLVGFITYLK